MLFRVEPASWIVSMRAGPAQVYPRQLYPPGNLTGRNCSCCWREQCRLYRRRQVETPTCKAGSDSGFDAPRGSPITASKNRAKKTRLRGRVASTKWPHNTSRRAVPSKRVATKTCRALRWVRGQSPVGRQYLSCYLPGQPYHKGRLD